MDRDCPVCRSKHNASLEKKIAVAGRYLIIHKKLSKGVDRDLLFGCDDPSL